MKQVINEQSNYQRWNTPEVKQSGQSERVVTPLVGARHKRTNEPRYHHHPRKEKSHNDVGYSHASEDEEAEENQWSIDEPLYVPHPLYGSQISILTQQNYTPSSKYGKNTYPDLPRSVMVEDDSEAQVRSHRIICDR